MNVQATKLELIKMIADIQSEKVLERVKEFLQKVETEERRDDVSSLSPKESELLIKINEGLPEEIQKKYYELFKKSVEENLSEKEREVFLELIPLVEAKHAERLKYIVELAELWGVSVDEVMNRLGIHPPPVIHV